MRNVKDVKPDKKTQALIDEDIRKAEQYLGHPLSEVDKLSIKASYVMGTDPMKEAFSMPE